jgi:hypothetical protein
LDVSMTSIPQPLFGSMPFQRSHRIASQPLSLNTRGSDRVAREQEMSPLVLQRQCPSNSGLSRPLAPGETRNRGHIDDIAKLYTLDVRREHGGSCEADGRLAGATGTRHEQEHDQRRTTRSGGINSR